MMASINKALPQGGADDIVQSLLHQIRSSRSETAVESSDTSKNGIPRTIPTAALQSEQACDITRQWILANNAELLANHPSFSRFVARLKSCLCTCPTDTLRCPSHATAASPDSLTLEDLVFLIGNCLSDCVNHMVPTVALGAKMVQELVDLAESKEMDAPSFPSSAEFLMKKEDRSCHVMHSAMQVMISQLNISILRVVDL